MSVRWIILTNCWWALWLVIVAVGEWRMGMKSGRRLGYIEGYRDGKSDAVRDIQDGVISLMDQHYRRRKNPPS